MEKRKIRIKRIIYFNAFVLLMLVEVYIAIFVRDNFIRPYIGDVLVVMVVYFFIRTIQPEGFKWLPLYIFLFAVCVEISQYLYLVQLLGMEDNHVISIIFGGTFDLVDIFCYGMGCAVLWSFSLFNFNRKRNATKTKYY